MPQSAAVGAKGVNGCYESVRQNKRLSQTAKSRTPPTAKEHTAGMCTFEHGEVAIAFDLFFYTEGDVHFTGHEQQSPQFAQARA